MTKKRLSTIAVAVALAFSITALRPAQAHAISKWAWVGIGVGIYAVFVVVATAIVFGDRAEASEPALEEAKRDQNAVSFGPTNCEPTEDGNLALVCW